MKRIRHSPEQIIRKLREADAELAKGTAIPEICKALGIAENTYYRWRNQFGGIKADEMRRLKELEKDRGVLLAFYEFPAEHWVHIRTTNPIESVFSTVRLRHDKAKGSGSRVDLLPADWSSRYESHSRPRGQEDFR